MVFFKRIGDLHFTGQQEPITLDETEVSEYLLADAENTLPEGYALLARNERTLEGVYRRLRSSPEMRPMLHIGWRQELKDKNETPWLTFSLQDEPEQEGLEGFEGVIRLSRNKGLLLESRTVGYKEVAESLPLEIETSETSDDVELLDLPFATDSEQQPEESNEKEELMVQDIQMPDQLGGFFEMSESIKVKLGKLYYIDHPTMGLLVKVTPYQASLEEQESLN
ncbi:hypothetical protein GCM10009123_19960 [Kangiella japonica]|uniref:Uncharacterized protein n=2 Tax=Kangiella japonica TaxID=647384 RepID=A0ABN0T516_9GAMM